MGKDAGSFLRIYGHLDEIIGEIDVYSVKPGQTIVHKSGIGQEKLSIVGGAAPDHVLQKEVQRSAQVRDDLGGKIRIELRIFREVIDVVHLQPMMEEVFHFGVGAAITQHAPGLHTYLLACMELPFGGSFP